MCVGSLFLRNVSLRLTLATFFDGHFDLEETNAPSSGSLWFLQTFLSVKKCKKKLTYVTEQTTRTQIFPVCPWRCRCNPLEWKRTTIDWFVSSMCRFSPSCPRRHGNTVGLFCPFLMNIQSNAPLPANFYSEIIRLQPAAGSVRFHYGASL